MPLGRLFVMSLFLACVLALPLHIGTLSMPYLWGEENVSASEGSGTNPPLLAGTLPTSSVAPTDPHTPPAHDIASHAPTSSPALPEHRLVMKLPKGTPFALFKWQNKIWVGVPYGTLSDTSLDPRFGRVAANGGDLYSLAVDSETFPSLKRTPQGIEIVMDKKPKLMDLNPRFLSPSILKLAGRKSINITCDVSHTISFTQKDGNPAFVMLTHDYYTGMGPTLRRDEFSLHATYQGLFIAGHHPSLGLKNKQLLLDDGFRPWVSQKETSPFSFHDFFQRKKYEHPAIEHAKRALLSGHTDRAWQWICELESHNALLESSQDFNALKGIILAFRGCASGALAAFGTSPSLWKTSQPFHAVPYIKSGHHQTGVKLLNRYFSRIKKMPMTFQCNLFFLGAESSLLLGSQKKADFFLSNLEKSPLNHEKKALLSLLKNNTLVDQTFIERQIAGASAASIAWQTYHMEVRKKLRKILLRYETRQATLSHTLFELEKLSQEGRGGVVEFEVLEKLALLYQKKKDYTRAMRAYDKLLRYSPEDDPKREVFLKAAQDIYIQALYREEWDTLTRCGFFKQYKAFLPADKRGDGVLSTFTMLFIEKGFIDHIVPILFQKRPQAPTANTKLLLACVKHYVKEGRYEEALWILNKDIPVPETLQDTWTLQKATALTRLHQAQEALRVVRNLPLTPAKAKVLLAIYRTTGDVDDMSHVLKYLIQETKNPDYVDQLGMLLYAQDNLTALDTFLTKAKAPKTSFISLLMMKPHAQTPKSVQELREQLQHYEFIKDYAQNLP
ncbi:hypothetical protein EIL50_03880 [bacterium NHP-B]|nr:hypothetical protein EIL50_03880 [bacterium NHP-B]